MVQNEFLELLLEIGLVGFALFGLFVVGFVVKTKRVSWVWAILAAFLVQWWFFSGYPNALHVFLILAFIYAYARGSKKTT